MLLWLSTPPTPCWLWRCLLEILMFRPILFLFKLLFFPCLNICDASSLKAVSCGSQQKIRKFYLQGPFSPLHRPHCNLNLPSSETRHHWENKHPKLLSLGIIKICLLVSYKIICSIESHLPMIWLFCLPILSFPFGSDACARIFLWNGYGRSCVHYHNFDCVQGPSNRRTGPSKD